MRITAITIANDLGFDIMKKSKSKKHLILFA